MKPRNREVNIFNMSVLDLLTGALGAFCFLTLALFPSYYKSASAPEPPDANARARSAGESGAGMSGAVPPFGFLALSNAVPDKALGCATLQLEEASSGAASGNLTSFPTGERQPNDASEGFFLFAFQPGMYHLAVQVAAATTPCDVSLSLMNPNNNWIKTRQVASQRQTVTFEFNMLSSDINSNLWNE
jgi:hypothetical protein